MARRAKKNTNKRIQVEQALCNLSLLNAQEMFIVIYGIQEDVAKSTVEKRMSAQQFTCM